jgi:hypothetical protein
MTTENNETVDQTNTNDTASDHTDSAADRHNSERQERGESVRETLRQSWKDATGEDPLPDEGREERRKRDEERERRQMERRGERPGRSARDAKAAASADAQQRDPTAAAQSKSAPLDTSEAPKSWRADEKAYYDALPQQIKNAIHRREADVQKGVSDLKARYEREDRAWAPHEQALRQFGVDRVGAIERLFGWHDILSRNPQQAWPALIQAQGHDPAMIAMAIVNAFPRSFPAQIQGAAQAAQQRLQTGQTGQQQSQGQQYDPRFLQYAQNVEADWVPCSRLIRSGCRRKLWTR